MSSCLVPRSTRILLMLILALVGSSLTSNLAAETRQSLVTADATVAASERQAVMGISRLGLEANRFTFPVFYTPHEGPTIPVGNWSVRISQEYADAILADNLSFIIPARYDRLVFENSQARFETATQVFSGLDVRQVIPELSQATRSYAEYREYLLDHLNHHIAPSMEEILGAAAEARYQEMNARERGTFITERARQTGMPAEVLEALISSSYAFGFYLPELRGRINIRQIERKRFDGSTYYVYQTTLAAPLKTRMLVYAFDGEQFTTQIELDAVPDGFFEGLSQQMSASASITTAWLPRERHAQQIFDDVFELSFKDSTIALSTRLKENRAFAVATPVIDATPEEIGLKVGNQEDIRVDQPFTFNRTIDGKETTIGWGRVRLAGNTCLILPEEERIASRAQLISGQVDEFDLAVEHPWTGVYGRTAFTQSMTELEIDGQATGAGNASFIELGFISNLGFLLNNRSFSEIWTNLDLGLGLLSNGEGNFDNLDGKGAIRVRFGAEKRFHMGYGLYASAGADLGYEQHNYAKPGGPSGLKDDFKVQTANLIPRAEIGYYINPNLKIYGGAAYNLPFYTDYEWDNGDSMTEDLSMMGGLSVQAGIAFHLGFAGPFASMMARPSTECEVLRDARLEAQAAEQAE
ncbi:hypothetical protein SAMN05660443_0812 [Marinospirillum celere]|uniref:Uncharacterized protein n=1 Tax=Marinospirillum celere TaxID=1122252 RepID=A0A1I1EYA8_9GAMM|nr:hypothetical protein [Marinospirillum celere]SFB89930.1 hypothetical protein SAMN05660443_0812 [Marinospirillum celere]